MPQEPWTATEVTMGDTTFYFDKLLPMEGYYLLEQLRPGVAESAVVTPTGSAPGAAVAAMFGAFPPDRVEAARKVLFGVTTFSRRGSGGRTRLAGEEGHAFQGLTPIHIAEVLARAFAVNFHDCWNVLLSRIPEVGALLDSLQSDTPTSQDSSPSP